MNEHPGAMIAALRGERGMTQTELAAIVGVKSAYISQIESGVRTGSWEVLCNIADALGVSVGDLRLTPSSLPSTSQAAAGM